MKTLTKEQEDELEAAFSSICNMSIASINNNHSRCGSFHIKPFNTHWDRKTAKEVMYCVKLYIDSWVVRPMERGLNKKRSDIDKYERSRHKKAGIRYRAWKLEMEAKTKKAKKNGK